jgi:protease IV
VTYVELNTGKFKDSGSPDKPLTDEERELFERDLNAVNDVFIDIVSTYRKLPREAVVALADGSSMTGARALENKLIDGVGGRLEAKQALAQILNKDISEVIFCEYESPILF